MQQLARDAAEQQTCAGRLEAAQQNLAARQSARNEEQETIRRLTQEIDSLRETLAMDMDKCHKAELVLGAPKSELEQMQQRIWDDYELTYAARRNTSSSRLTWRGATSARATSAGRFAPWGRSTSRRWRITVPAASVTTIWPVSATIW
ncbi:MAG: hypothetical protein ACLS7Z_02465 [Christensenellales bacterium]